jgi:hemin uptake protein HemP
MGDQSNKVTLRETPGLAPVFAGSALPDGRRQVAVSAILGADQEVLLIHNGEAYRLRITANNKLILTK